MPAGESGGGPSHPRLHPCARTDQSVRAGWHRLDSRGLGAGRHAGDLPAGTARLVAKPARRLMFEVHYTPNGTEQTDRSSVGIIFAKKPPEHVAETNILANLPVKIPPKAANRQGEMTYTFPEDALVLSFMPHMHLRGTSAKYVATYPDGKTETLLSVPDYDFNWQSVYRFAEPLKIPKGTKLTWIGQLGQLGRQPAQSRPDERGPLGPADVGRNAERLDGRGVEKKK